MGSELGWQMGESFHGTMSELFGDDRRFRLGKFFGVNFSQGLIFHGEMSIWDCSAVVGLFI